MNNKKNLYITKILHNLIPKILNCLKISVCDELNEIQSTSQYCLDNLNNFYEINDHYCFNMVRHLFSLFTNLFEVLDTYLMSGETILNLIMKKPKIFDQNLVFDLLRIDLKILSTIRELVDYYEIIKMLTSPLLLINNCESKLFWKENFGEFTFMIENEIFIKSLIKQFPNKFLWLDMLQVMDCIDINNDGFTSIFEFKIFTSLFGAINNETSIKSFLQLYNKNIFNFRLSSPECDYLLNLCNAGSFVITISRDDFTKFVISYLVCDNVNIINPPKQNNDGRIIKKKIISTNYPYCLTIKCGKYLNIYNNLHSVLNNNTKIFQHTLKCKLKQNDSKHIINLLSTKKKLELNSILNYCIYYMWWISMNSPL